MGMRKGKMPNLEQCCVDDQGKAKPYHLRCQRCRELLAAMTRAELLDAGRSPVECGPEPTQVAPARGRVRVFRPTVMLPDGKGDYIVVNMGYRDRAAMASEDVFDRMNAQAVRAKGIAYPAHLVEAGRAYRSLVERISAAGVKISSTFNAKTGGGGRVDFMDAYAQDVQRLRRLHKAIGNRTIIKRRQDAEGNVTAEGLTARDLADMVCLREMELSAVLEATGRAASGKGRKVLKVQLWAILERLHRK